MSKLTNNSTSLLHFKGTFKGLLKKNYVEHFNRPLIRLKSLFVVDFLFFVEI